MVLCFLCVFLKTSAAGGFLFDLRFMPLGFAAGFLLIPVHELLHAVCYPAGATVYTGVCLKKVAAYAVSFFPISRGRYILMSLLPALLGLIPLALFLLCPPQWKGLLTACVVPAFMGLISPCPDYMDVALILKQAPAGAKIQAANDGLYYIAG